MATVLTTKRRKALPDSAFAIVKKVKGKTKMLKVRKYPMPDIAHARNALARVSAFGTPAEKTAVRKMAYSKFPGLKKRKAERGGKKK